MKNNFLHVVEDIFLHFANLWMVIKPTLDLSLIRILSCWISTDLLLLLFARRNQVFDQVQAPVGEVVVVLVCVRTCDSPLLDGTILAGLKLRFRNLVWKCNCSIKFVVHKETRPVLDRFHDSSKVNALVCFMLYALVCFMLYALVCFMLYALRL